MGHELCGEVVALGAGIEDLELGDLVAVEPAEGCGQCLHCGLGQYNHCPLLAIQGYNRGGGLAEYTVVKRRLAHRLPPGRHGAAGRADRAAGDRLAHGEPLRGGGRAGGRHPRRRPDWCRRLPHAAAARRRGDHRRSLARTARGAGRPRRAPAARSGQLRRGGGDPRSHRRPRRACLDRRGRGAAGVRRDAARHPRRWHRGGGRDPSPAARHPAVRPADAGSAPHRRGAVGERLSRRSSRRWPAAAIRSRAGSRPSPSRA